MRAAADDAGLLRARVDFAVAMIEGASLPDRGVRVKVAGPEWTDERSVESLRADETGWLARLGQCIDHLPRAAAVRLA